MTDTTRKITYESDKDYVARTFDEALKELTKVQAAIHCKSFSLDEDSKDVPCEMCAMYDINNVRRLKAEGMQDEKCSIRLALNGLAAVRNIAKTGKP